MREPEVVEALARMSEEQGGGIPLEGFDDTSARLANLEDRLTQLMYVQAGLDPSTAPRAPRPEMPHEQRRRELKQNKARALELRLIQGGG